MVIFLFLLVSCQVCPIILVHATKLVAKKHDPKEGANV